MTPEGGQPPYSQPPLSPLTSQVSGFTVAGGLWQCGGDLCRQGGAHRRKVQPTLTPAALAAKIHEFELLLQGLFPLKDG